jgi:hypothetical protein
VRGGCCFRAQRGPIAHTYAFARECGSSAVGVPARGGVAVVPALCVCRPIAPCRRFRCPESLCAVRTGGALAVVCVLMCVCFMYVRACVFMWWWGGGWGGGVGGGGGGVGGGQCSV